METKKLASKMLDMICPDCGFTWREALVVFNREIEPDNPIELTCQNCGTKQIVFEGDYE